MSDARDENENDAVDSYRSHMESMIQWHEDDDWDRKSEMVMSGVLSAEETKRIDICLGTGGPGYHLIADLDRDGDVSSVSFWYYNWFFSREFPIENNTEEGKAVKSFVEFIIESY
tara:strand:+ start:694 stop:1038 length:345 start_codon:yes stop_codon:yes gene_type:complete